MNFEGPTFSIGIPANDNPVRVHHVDWSGRAARERLELDTSEFVFKEGTTWSPELLKHRNHRVEETSEDRAHAASNPRPWQPEGRPTSSATASVKQCGSVSGGHAVRGLTFVGLGIGLDHLVFSALNVALADDRNADSLIESPQPKPTDAHSDQPQSVVDDHPPEPAHGQASRHGSQAVGGDLQLSAVGVDDLRSEDAPPFAPLHQSNLATAGTALAADTPPQAAPAGPVVGSSLANPPGLRLQGTAGDDVLIGSEGDDVLAGAGGADTLVGLGGDDVLDGGEGADLMLGGDGDDAYVVDDAGDVVVERAEEGIDTVETTLQEYRLTDHVENLRFVGSGNFTGHGNSGDNLIVSGDGDDWLVGDEMSDDAPSGLEHLAAVAQSVSDAAESIEAALSEIIGPQAPGFEFGTAVISISTSSPGQPATEVQGTGANDVLLGRSGSDDAIYGAKGNDALIGGLGFGQDTLDGGQGNDTLEGGRGDDQLTGGMGNDSFVFRNGFGSDVITDFGDSGGNHDVIMFSLSSIDGYDDLEGRIQQVGDDVLISITENDSITLQNFQMINLSVNDHFVFA